MEEQAEEGGGEGETDQAVHDEVEQLQSSNVAVEEETNQESDAVEVPDTAPASEHTGLILTDRVAGTVCAIARISLSVRPFVRLFVSTLSFKPTGF